MSAPHIAIIGAGIIGASIAWHLAGAGARVTVIDRKAPGRGATRGSLAWINAHEISNPGYFALRVESMRQWHDMQAAIPDLPLRFGGCLNWEDPVDEMASLASACTGYGAPTRVVMREEIAAMFPSLAAPEAALWSENDGVANPDLISEILLAAAVDRGARLAIGEAVQEIAAHGRRITVGDRVIEADHTIIAAGIASIDLLAALDCDLPLTGSPGMLMRTNPLPRLTDAFFAAPLAHLWQMADGRLIAGADYAGTFDGTEIEATIARSLSTLADLFPNTGPIYEETHYITDRPIPADGLPIMGPVPGIDRVSVAVLHSGVTLAPVVGEMMSKWILRGAVPNEMAPYGISRFAG